MGDPVNKERLWPSTSTVSSKEAPMGAIGTRRLHYPTSSQTTSIHRGGSKLDRCGGSTSGCQRWSPSFGQVLVTAKVESGSVDRRDAPVASACCRWEAAPNRRRVAPAPLGAVCKGSAGCAYSASDSSHGDRGYQLARGWRWAAPLTDLSARDAYPDEDRAVLGLA